MAKLNAPLMSFGASGKIADALVYFPWKGLNVARQYVVPANPKTQPQRDQRGYLTAAVTAIHAAQAAAADPMSDTDKSAYALWSSCEPTPRTWFNQACKNWIDQNVDELLGAIFRGGAVTVLDGSLEIVVRSSQILAAGINAGRFYYGISKTALISYVAAVPNVGNNQMNGTIPALTNGTKYFIQFRPTWVADYIGANSGIYHGTPKA